ncbi:MAG: hypothetical protein ACXWZM_11550 [Solirubrobacterales bacterium]
MPQHMEALAHANRVRLARAALKRSVARDERSVAGVIREAPWETASMTLAELLTAQRRWGRTRARKFLLPLALNENKRMGTLTHRQRLMLASELEAKAGTAPATAEHQVALAS